MREVEYQSGAGWWRNKIMSIFLLAVQFVSFWIVLAILISLMHRPFSCQLCQMFDDRVHFVFCCFPLHLFYWFSYKFRFLLEMVCNALVACVIDFPVWVLPWIRKQKHTLFIWNCYNCVNSFFYIYNI